MDNLTFLDPNNPLLASGPARLDGGTFQVPGQPVQGVLTMRTTSGTLTAIMSADDLDNWAKFVAALADQVRGGAKPALQAASVMDVAVISQAMQAEKR